MTFVKHRHDMMHRGQVPADQLAEGTPEHGDVPTWNEYDEVVEWAPPTGEEHPDLAAHDTLGLATQDELDAHADDDGIHVSEASVRDAGHWEVIMVPGITAPPEPLLTLDESDWIWGWVPG